MNDELNIMPKATEALARSRESSPSWLSMLVPISMIMIVVAFQSALLPVSVFITRLLITSKLISISPNDLITPVLLINFILQAAGFLLTVLILWLRNRNFSTKTTLITLELDVGMGFRQLSILQFLRFIGMFILLFMLLILGIPIDEMAGNPYAMFLDVPRAGWFSMALLVVVVVVFGPLFEELLYRVLLISELERLRLDGGVIIFLTGILFALAHAQTNALAALQEGSYVFFITHFFNSTLTGMFLAYVYRRTRSLTTIWFMHALFNFIGSSFFLGIEDTAILLNVFLFFLGFYLVIRNYRLVPLAYRKTINVITLLTRLHVPEPRVFFLSLAFQALFEILIPVPLLLFLNVEFLTPSLLLSLHGALSFVVFLLIIIKSGSKMSRRETVQDFQQSLEKEKDA